MFNARRTGQSVLDCPGSCTGLNLMNVSNLKTVPVVYYIAYVNGKITQLNHHDLFID